MEDDSSGVVFVNFRNKLSSSNHAEIIRSYEIPTTLACLTEYLSSIKDPAVVLNDPNIKEHLEQINSMCELLSEQLYNLGFHNYQSCEEN